MICPYCGPETELEFTGEMAAPGFGRCWSCQKCGARFVQIGSTVIDTASYQDEEPPWILSPEDVV